jgi:hypothetical protein
MVRRHRVSSMVPIVFGCARQSQLKIFDVAGVAHWLVTRDDNGNDNHDHVT